MHVGPLPDSRLRGRRICAVRWVVCASPDYPAPRGEPRTLSDSEPHDCVRLHGFDPPGRWLFETPEGPAAAAIRSRATFDRVGRSTTACFRSPMEVGC